MKHFFIKYWDIIFDINKQINFLIVKKVSCSPNLVSIVLLLTNRHFTLVFLLAFFSSFIHAQSPFVLNGTAIALGGDCYRLTPAVNTSAGSIWYNQKINLSSDFVAEFDINLGCSNSGADGIAFVLQPISTGLGSLGSGIGYYGIQPSLVVEFDTWQNCCDGSTATTSAEANDPAQDHVAIMKNGTINHNSINNLAGPVDIIPNTNAEDCQYHNVRIVWNAAQQRITVFVDCLQRLTYQGSIISSIFSNNPNVYMGFTSSTGAANNDHRVCFKYLSFLNKIADKDICEGSSVQIAAPSNFLSYQWSPSTNVSNPNSPNPFFSPKTTTNYIVAMTDRCGNIVRDTVEVKVTNVDLKVDTLLGDPCSSNPTFRLSASSIYPGTLFAINSPTNFSTDGSFSNISTFNFNQNYTIYAKVGNCIISKVINIPAPKPLKDNLIAQQDEICTKKGSIKIVGVDGVPPYQYSINNGASQSSGDFQNLSAGVYTIKIKDAKGCEVQRQVTLDYQFKKLDLQIVNSRVIVDCFNSNAFVDVVASGTAPLYYYAIDNQSFSVNSTFSNLTSGTHKIIAKDENGCLSDELNFTVISHISNPIYRDTVNICFGQTYSYNGQVYSNQGVYTHTFKTIYGCDSLAIITLNVKSYISNWINKTVCFGESVNMWNTTYSQSGVYSNSFKAASGCDSIVYFSLTIRPLITNYIKTQICSPNNYYFNGKFYDKTGIYNDVLKTKSGCDSIVTIDLTVYNPKNRTLNIQLCEPQVFKIKNRSYSVSGTYRDTLRTLEGCDSFVVTNLTIFPIKKTIVFKEICFGQNYIFNGNTYNQTGVYKDILKTIHGCDSIVTTNLSVKAFVSNAIIKTLCFGESIKIGSATYSQSGIYKDTLMSVGGCDSIINLNLTVLPLITNYIKTQICSPDDYIFNNKKYNQTGIYKDTLVAINGCDSIVTIDLTVYNPKNKTLNIQLCEPEVFKIKNKSYTVSGIYRDTLQSLEGCDSIVVTNLTIFPIKKTTIVKDICFGQTYFFNGNAYDKTGIYYDTLNTIHGCDSVITTNLTIKSFVNTFIKETLCFGESIKIGNIIYSQTGIYKDTLKTASGCDSIVDLDLTVRNLISYNIKAQYCSPKTFTYNNKIYHKTGIYKEILKAKNGCDSVITIDLIIIKPETKTLNIQLCEPQTFSIKNKTYSVSGIYRDTLQTLEGCDSVVITNLKVSPRRKTDIFQQFCEGQSFALNGKIYTDTGIYYDSLKTINGCDSVLEITIKQTKPSYYTEKKTICETELLTINGTKISTSGIYNFTYKNRFQCDSFYTLDLTILDTSKSYQEYFLCEDDSVRVGDYMYHKTGTYNLVFKNSIGCDSTLTFKIKYGSEAYCEEKYGGMYIPNIFSPNNDNQNDVFEAYSLVAKFSQLQIFDRWGDLQYEEFSANPRWNGLSHHGEAMNIGVYVYVLRGFYSNGKPFIKTGDVMLIR